MRSALWVYGLATPQIMARPLRFSRGATWDIQSDAHVRFTLNRALASRRLIDQFFRGLAV